MSFIYKNETSTLDPFVKPRDVLNLAVRNVFYVQSCMESAFTYNLGSTQHPQSTLPKDAAENVAGANPFLVRILHPIFAGCSVEFIPNTGQKDI